MRNSQRGQNNKESKSMAWGQQESRGMGWALLRRVESRLQNNGLLSRINRLNVVVGWRSALRRARFCAFDYQYSPAWL